MSVFQGGNNKKEKKKSNSEKEDVIGRVELSVRQHWYILHAKLVLVFLLFSLVKTQHFAVSQL